MRHRERPRSNDNLAGVTADHSWRQREDVERQRAEEKQRHDRNIAEQ
jgi:hypothetical protein